VIAGARRSVATRKRWQDLDPQNDDGQMDTRADFLTPFRIARTLVL
jgi:hypothetical protein